MTFQKLTTLAPEGYSQWLWDAIPANRAKAFPGKHETYIFGQQRADGTACVGCSWQSSQVFGSSEQAIKAHDTDLGIEHDHSLWIPGLRGNEQTCPCQQQNLAHPINLDAEAVRAELREAATAHHLSNADAEALIALDDNLIHSALAEAADDHFWSQFDTVRTTAISTLARNLHRSPLPTQEPSS